MRVIPVGLLGLGTVGTGVVQIIHRHQEEWMARYGFQLLIKKIHVRDINKPRTIAINPDIFTADPADILGDSAVEIVIEAMGGEEPALQYATTALSRGKHLITANKLLLALHGPALFRLAREHGVEIGLEGSVGGGIPIIQPLRELIHTNFVQSMLGIINGTTNYMLTAMSELGEGYADVLARAQALGYAEADPSSDVDGWDACYKLSVLTGIAFCAQLPVGLIHTEGITRITRIDHQMAFELGYRIKLAAKAERAGNGWMAHVHPTLLPLRHPFAAVQGVNNALLVKGDAVGEVLFYGPGAGQLATGSAVVSDLVRIGRQIAHGHLDQSPIPHWADEKSILMNRGSFFITVQSIAKPNLSVMVAMLQDCGISTESVLQKGDSNLYYLGLITRETSETAVRQAVNRLSEDPYCQRIFYYYVEGFRQSDIVPF